MHFMTAAGFEPTRPGNRKAVLKPTAPPRSWSLSPAYTQASGSFTLLADRAQEAEKPDWCRARVHISGLLHTLLEFAKHYFMKRFKVHISVGPT